MEAPNSSDLRPTRRDLGRLVRPAIAAAIAVVLVASSLYLRDDGPHRWDWHGREAEATALAERLIAERPPGCDARAIDLPVLGRTDSVCVGLYRDLQGFTFHLF